MGKDGFSGASIDVSPQTLLRPSSSIEIRGHSFVEVSWWLWRAEWLQKMVMELHELVRDHVVATLGLFRGQPQQPIPEMIVDSLNVPLAYDPGSLTLVGLLE